MTTVLMESVAHHLKNTRVTDQILMPVRVYPYSRRVPSYRKRPGDMLTKSSELGSGTDE